MTKANPFAVCRTCGATFLKPRKRSVFCSLRCAVFAHVQPGPADACWEWQAHLKSNGYGVFSYNGKFRHAHRAMLELSLGRPPGAGMETRHKCDNPSCVNPDHLCEGTRSDNMRDAVERGRLAPIPPARRGTAHYKAILNETIVREIRRAKESSAVVANRYGIAPQTVRKVRSRRSWAHVK